MFKKILSFSLAAILGSVLLFSCGKVQEKTKDSELQKPAAVNMQKVTLDVQGMTCSGCEYNVESALKNVAGVTNAKADYTSNSAQVEFDPDVTNVEQLVEAVNHVGYSAKALNSNKPGDKNGKKGEN